MSVNQANQGLKADDHNPALNWELTEHHFQQYMHSIGVFQLPLQNRRLQEDVTKLEDVLRQYILSITVHVAIDNALLHFYKEKWKIPGQCMQWNIIIVFDTTEKTQL